MRDGASTANDGTTGGDPPRPETSGDKAGEPAGAGREEISGMLASGPKSGDRAGGLAFLALMIVLGAVLHFYFGGGGYLAGDLDAELRRHAELSLAAHKENPNLVIVPSWPVRLYGILRRDLLVYLAFGAAAAYLWGLSARARARRDAYLVHENCQRELAELRERLARLENPPFEGGAERGDNLSK